MWQRTINQIFFKSYLQPSSQTVIFLIRSIDSYTCIVFDSKKICRKSGNSKSTKLVKKEHGNLLFYANTKLSRSQTIRVFSSYFYPFWLHPYCLPFPHRQACCQSVNHVWNSFKKSLEQGFRVKIILNSEYIPETLYPCSGINSIQKNVKYFQCF